MLGLTADALPLWSPEGTMRIKDGCRSGSRGLALDLRFQGAEEASPPLGPPGRDSWPSRNAPCSVKTKRVALSSTDVNSTVASETEILVSCRCMS